MGVTGHRAAHPSYPQNPSGLSDVIQDIFASVETNLAKANATDCTARILTLLSDGTDHLAANLALDREWELVVPLPFGQNLNTAINTGAADPSIIREILAGESPSDPSIAEKAATIEDLADRSALFELADNDAKVEKLLIEASMKPEDQGVQSALAAATAQRTALAGQILIEQSDLMIAVWDGQSTANIGGTGHTALMALESGISVIWIDPSRPADWSLLSSPEELFGALPAPDPGAISARLEQIVAGAIAGFDEKTTQMLVGLKLTQQSSFASHAFRRVQALFGERGFGKKFGSIRQRYEQPGEVAQGSGKPVVSAIFVADT